MEGMLLPILVAASVALVVFGATRVTVALADGEKRRLQQRLATDQRGGSSNVNRSITVQQHELGGISGALTQTSLFGGLNRLLLHAFPDMTLSRFLLVATSISMSLFLLTFLLAGSVLVALVAAALGGYAPVLVATHRRNKRQRLLADQLPEGLDFLSRVLRAGHSLSTGLQMMGEELPQPLAGEFRRAYDQHSLGLSLEEALKDVSRRVESTDFAFFVTAVLIQRQTGGDLSEVLGNISGVIRERIRLQQHVKAKTAEGRFTGYILSAFPAVMFVIAYTLNPDYAGVLIKTNVGLILLGVAFGLQMVGLYCIKKITTVTV